MKLLSIVEGQGELAAVPILLRKILHDNGQFEVEVMRPQVRGDIHKVRKNFSRFFQMAMKEKAAVLWILDCDDGCPVLLAQELHGLAEKEFAPYPYGFCFLVKEYESLFLADPNSTKTKLEIKESVEFPSDVESIRGVKEWLSQQMSSGHSYKPTVHQSALTGSVKLDQLRKKSPSCRHLEKKISNLISKQL